jgi:hypothetical protein
MVSRWEDGQANKLKNECMNRRRQMDSWKDGQMDRQMEKKTHGQMDRQMEKRTDRLIDR